MGNVLLWNPALAACNDTSCAIHLHLFLRSILHEEELKCVFYTASYNSENNASLIREGILYSFPLLTVVVGRHTYIFPSSRATLSSSSLSSAAPLPLSDNARFICLHLTAQPKSRFLSLIITQLIHFDWNVQQPSPRRSFTEGRTSNITVFLSTSTKDAHRMVRRLLL